MDDRAIDRKARWLFSGVLVLGALVAAGWYFFWSTRYTTYEIVTHDPVSGLIVDSPVEYHGVDVGKVKRVELADPRTIRVLVAIRDDAPVSRATVATITSRGLATRGFTGYVVIALEDRGAGTGPIVAAGGRYPAIPTMPSEVVNLDMAIAQVNANVQQLSDLIRGILDPKTVASLKESTDGLQKVTKTLQSQVLPEAYKTMAKLDEVSSSLNGFAEKVSKDPSVIVRGPGRQPLGPGEKK